MKVLSLPKALFTLIFSWTIANTLLTASSEINPLFVANLRGKFSLIEEEIKNPLEQLQEKLKNKMFSPVEFEKKKNELFSDSFKKNWTTYKEEINKDNEPHKLSLLFENFESLVKSTPQNLSSYIDTVPLAKLITLFHFCSFLKLRNPWSKKLTAALIKNAATLIAKKPDSFFETKDGKLLLNLLYKYNKPQKAYLKRPLHCPIKTEKPINVFALNPSKNLVALGLADGFIKLFDLKNMEELMPSLYHGGTICSLQFNDDGSFIAADSDNSMTVWETKTGRYLTGINHHGPARLFTFSPKGDKLASYTTLGTIVHIFDLTTLNNTTYTKKPNVSHVRFSKNGKTLAMAQTLPEEKKSCICIVDSEKEAIIKKITYNSTISPFQFNHDGTKALIGSNEGICLIDINKEKKLATFSVDSKAGTCNAGFSPDGTKIFIHSKETIEVWKIKPKTLLLTIPHEKSVSEVQFSKDGNKLITKTSDSNPQLWNLQDGNRSSNVNDCIVTKPTIHDLSIELLNPHLTFSDKIFLKLRKTYDASQLEKLSKLFPPALISPLTKRLLLPQSPHIILKDSPIFEISTLTLQELCAISSRMGKLIKSEDGPLEQLVTKKKVNELFSNSFKDIWKKYKEKIDKNNEINNPSALFKNFESLVERNVSSSKTEVPLKELIALFRFYSYLKLKETWSKKLVNAFVEKVATLIAKDPGSFFETEDGKILTKFLANFKKPKYPHYFFIKNQDDFGAIALSPSAPLLALGLRCRIDLFDVEKMQWLDSLSCEGRITSLLFSNDGSKLLSNADNKVTKDGIQKRGDASPRSNIQCGQSARSSSAPREINLLLMESKKNLLEFLILLPGSILAYPMSPT